MKNRQPLPADQPAALRRESGDEYLYRRVEAALRTMISDGALLPGARLPSEVKLAQRFGTTRVTVAKALSMLERDGLIRRAVGRGTFVSETEPVTSVIDTGRILSFEEQVGFAGHSVRYRVLGFEQVGAPPFARDRLGLAPAAKVFRLERLRIIKGHVVCLEERFVRTEFGEHITPAMLSRQSAMDILGGLLGYHVPVLEVVLYPAVADRRLAQRMQIRPGSPVTVREHVLRDRQRRAIECGINTFTAEARIAYTLGVAEDTTAGAAERRKARDCKSAPKNDPL